MLPQSALDIFDLLGAISLKKNKKQKTVVTKDLGPGNRFHNGFVLTFKKPT